MWFSVPDFVRSPLDRAARRLERESGKLDTTYRRNCAEFRHIPKSRCQSSPFCLCFAYQNSLGDEVQMLKTILLGSRVLVQGTFVKKLADGKVAVKVGDQIYHGKLVATERAA